MRTLLKPLFWPWPTETLRWCPECKFWTVPLVLDGDECRCGTTLSESWMP